MATDDDRPLTRQEYRQLRDVFLLGVGALLGIGVIMAVTGVPWWAFGLLAAGWIWLAWLGLQLRDAGRRRES